MAIQNRTDTLQKRELRNWRAIALVYHLAGLILSGISLGITLTNEKESFIFICCLLYPLIGVVIVIVSERRIGLNLNVKWEEEPGILFGLLFTIMAASFQVIRNYYLFRFSDVIIACGSATALITLILYSTVIRYQTKRSLIQLVFTIIPVVIYSFAATVIVNCNFDDSPPIKFNATVESKFIKAGRNADRYILTIGPWERGQAPIEIDVTRTEYEQTPVDGPVGGHIKRGLLDIKWFYLDM